MCLFGGMNNCIEMELFQTRFAMEPTQCQGSHCVHNANIYVKLWLLNADD